MILEYQLRVEEFDKSKVKKGDFLIFPYQDDDAVNHYTFFKLYPVVQTFENECAIAIKDRPSDRGCSMPIFYEALKQNGQPFHLRFETRSTINRNIVIGVPNLDNYTEEQLESIVLNCINLQKPE